MTNLVVGHKAAFALNGKLKIYGLLGKTLLLVTQHKQLWCKKFTSKNHCLTNVMGLFQGLSFLIIMQLTVILRYSKWRDFGNFGFVFHVQFNHGYFGRFWQIEDGPSVHHLRQVNYRLEEVFQNRIIAVKHEEEWSPGSTVLRLCHFFLWGYKKSQVYLWHRRKIFKRFMKESCWLSKDFRIKICPESVRALEARTQKCLQWNGRHIQGIQTKVFK